MKKFKYSYSIYILWGGFDKNGNHIRRWRLLRKGKANLKSVILNRVKAYTDSWAQHYKISVKREVK